MLKLGTKLICHTDFFYYVNKERATTEGKVYIIRKIGSTMFEIIDDCNRRHNFTFDNYKTVFITFTELRKKKLEKLGCTSLISTEE